MAKTNLEVTNRLMAVEYNNLSRPDGSAIYSLGDTVVQGAVYGPVEVRGGKELINKANLEIVYRTKIGQSGCADRVKENFIKNTLDAVTILTQHPRTNILVVLQEFQDSGCLLVACVNCAVLAFMDSGLSLNCTVAAAAATIRKNGDILINPSLTEEKLGRATLTFAFESVNKKVISVSTQGSFSELEYEQCLKACRETVEEVFKFYRKSIERRYMKEMSDE